MSTEELRSKWKKQLKKDTASKLKSLVTEVSLQFSQFFKIDLNLTGIIASGYSDGEFSS